MKQYILSEIWIYPIKSLGGVRLNSAKVFEKGLEFDRRWMLVDEHGIFMTQRIYPKMALFKLSQNGQSLTITFKANQHDLEHPSITLDTNNPASGAHVRATIWDDEVNVVEVDSKISNWFSKYLDIKCRLVSFPENNPRLVDPAYRIKNEHVSLADAYPFLIIGQSSFDDLNSKLENNLPLNRRFRPNFVFTGGQPYEEDTWRSVTIGKNRFTGVKNCARCVLITVDQDSAEKGTEPLLTLSAYRKKENKVYFGQNLVAMDHGVVNVGDVIIVN